MFYATSNGNARWCKNIYDEMGTSYVLQVPIHAAVQRAGFDPEHPKRVRAAHFHVDVSHLVQELLPDLVRFEADVKAAAPAVTTMAEANRLCFITARGSYAALRYIVECFIKCAAARPRDVHGAILMDSKPIFKLFQKHPVFDIPFFAGAGFLAVHDIVAQAEHDEFHCVHPSPSKAVVMAPSSLEHMATKLVSPLAKRLSQSLADPTDANSALPSRRQSLFCCKCGQPNTVTKGMLLRMLQQLLHDETPRMGEPGHASPALSPARHPVYETSNPAHTAASFTSACNSAHANRFTPHANEDHPLLNTATPQSHAHDVVQGLHTPNPTQSHHASIPTPVPFQPATLPDEALHKRRAPTSSIDQVLQKRAKLTSPSVLINIVDLTQLPDMDALWKVLLHHLVFNQPSCMFIACFTSS